MVSTLPPPQATSMPAGPAARTVPGAAWEVRSETRDFHSFKVSPVRASVDAPGQGIRPRIWSWIAWAGRVQSTGDRALDSMGA